MSEKISYKNAVPDLTLPQTRLSPAQSFIMPKSAPSLDWCVVRLGDDHNWWVDEISDPVHWDVDGLSIIDPRQVAHIIDLIEPLRDYGFEQDVMERAVIAFRIDKDLGNGNVRLVRSKESIFDSDEKLFALPNVLDEENGPYADLLDHITRCRVKMLNDIFDFESKLTVDEVEDQLREDQNTEFIEGKAVHLFNEITAILDFVPEGWDVDHETPAKGEEDVLDDEKDDLPEIEEEEEEKLKNDQSLKWDEDEESEDEDEEGKEKKAKDDDDDDDESSDEEDEKPRRGRRGSR